MKKLKTILSILLCVLAISSFVACKTDEPSSYNVTIGTQSQVVVEGSLLTEPTAPTKDATVAEVFTFDGWYIKDTNTKWNFATDKVTGDVVLEARFTSSARKYNVKVGDDATIQLAYGDKITKPQDPTKEPNASTVYTFDAWYIKNTTTKWDFDTNTVTGDVVLEAKFNKSTRTYEVKIGDETPIELAYGSYVEEPATPTKPDEGETTYVFDGWYIKGTTTKWNFATSKVTKDIELVAKFNAEVKKYNYVFNLSAPTITANDKTYPLFIFNEEMASKYQLTITDKDSEPISGIKINADGTVNARLPKGDYTYVLSADYAVSDVFGTFTVSADSQKDVVCPAIVQLNGYMGTGEADAPYKYQSFNANSIVEKDSVIMTSHTFVFAGDGKLVDAMYIEFDVTFPSARVGSMVGVLGACEYGNISGETTSKWALQGSGDTARKKVAFSLSGGNKVYYQDMGGYGGGNVNGFIDASAYNVNSHKLAVLRNGYDFYVFIDGDYLGKYTTTTYGKGGFGLILTNPVGSGTDYVTKNENIRYITDKNVIAMMTKDI